MKPPKIRVLLIDDEEEFILALSRRLEFRGYNCKTAGDGESGIRLVENETFDIALIDLMMPGLNGLDTLKQIKTMNQEMPVILLTGNRPVKDGMAGMRMGAFDYLIKPLDINALIEKIELALLSPPNTLHPEKK
jgi:DNA-binding response OmpR family regulator